LSQGIFTLSVDSSFQEYQDIEIIGNSEYFSFDADMKNVGDANLNIDWKVLNIENCPEEWNPVVADKYLDYLLEADSENAIPIDLEPHEEAPFNVNFIVQEVAGCCSLSIEFIDADTSVPVDTSYYYIAINSDCTITTTNELKNPNRENMVFPNPASEFISVKMKDDYLLGEIHSIFGNKIMTFVPIGIEKIDLSKVPAGVYFVSFTRNSNKKDTFSFIKI